VCQRADAFARSFSTAVPARFIRRSLPSRSRSPAYETTSGVGFDQYVRFMLPLMGILLLTGLARLLIGVLL
jgi:hypothetical protein